MDNTAPDTRFVVDITAALSVELRALLMVITNTEHPPAASAAFALVIDPWSWSAILFVISSAIILSGVRIILRPKLINLLRTSAMKRQRFILVTSRRRSIKSDPVLQRIEPLSMALERKPVNRLANCLLEIDTEALKFAIRSAMVSQIDIPTPRSDQGVGGMRENFQSRDP